MVNVLFGIFIIVIFLLDGSWISMAIRAGDTFFYLLKCPYWNGAGTPAPSPTSVECYVSPIDSRYEILWKPYQECPSQAGSASGCYWVTTDKYLRNTYLFEGDWVLDSNDDRKFLTGVLVVFNVVWLLWLGIIVMKWRQRVRDKVSERISEITSTDVVSEIRVPLIPLEISEVEE